MYYCSSFDLDVNEWFNEYENTQIFRKRMKEKLGNYYQLINYLGQNWTKYILQALETTQSVDMEDDGCNSDDNFSSEDTEDSVSNQCQNIALEYFLIIAQLQDEVIYGDIYL